MTAPQKGDYIKVQGNKQYLPVPARVQWFRGEHPDWTISTSVVELAWSEGYAVMRAEVLDDTGRLIASGMKTETRKGFGDFVEKAETGAVGRALARAGYGTEDALDLEGDRYADAPIETERGRGAGPSASSPRDPAPAARYRQDELLALVAAKGLNREALERYAAIAGVEPGTRATNEQTDLIIEYIEGHGTDAVIEPPASPGVSDSGPTEGPEVVPPSTSGPPPKPGTDEYKALPVQDRANAKVYWANPPEQESLAELMGAPV